MSRIPTRPANPAITALQSAQLERVRQAATKVDTSKLENLKERLDGIDTDAFEDAGSRFQEGAFGRVVSSPRPGGASGLDHGTGSGRSKNPLDQQPALARTGNGAYSDGGGGSEEAGTWDSIKNWFMSLVGSGAGGAGAKTTTGNGAGAVGGAAFGILTANGTPEEKRNEAEGIIGVFRQGKKGTINEEAAAQLDQIDWDQEPAPDSPSGGSRGGPSYVDPALLSGLRRDQQSEYPDGAEAGGGGPVNTGANGAGAIGTRAEFVTESGNTTTINSLDVKSIAVRRLKNFTPTE